MTDRSVPYFSQFETPDLINAYERERCETILADDPLWHESGALSRDEYARWAANICGMACLKMILAARGRPVPGTLDLAKACAEYGGYVVETETGHIKGLIYAPFVTFIGERFGLSARVLTDITAAQIPALLSSGGFFVASVHPSIRRPKAHPPARGGHLVLITAATDDGITFHNPSGHTDAARIDVFLPLPQFARFFAGRGIVVSDG